MDQEQWLGLYIRRGVIQASIDMKVPLGDAFDKMTILEIKAQNSINNRLSILKCV